MNTATNQPRLVVCVLAALLVLLPSAAAAQRRGADLSQARAAFAELDASLQQEIAARMLRRPQAINEGRVRLEIEIDLRLLARTAFVQAAGAAAGSDAQACANLRGRLFLEAISMVEATLDRQQNKLSPTQAEAASNLQKLTFMEVKTPKDLELVSRRFGPILLALLGEAPLDTSRLPVLRPRPIAPEQEADGPGTTLPQMAEEINRLNISVALRQQLVALAARAANPPGADDEARAKEAALLTGTLRESLELARALAANTAVQPDARLRMEAQLGEGLALLMDARTRELGQSRLAAMAQYRQTVGRISRMNLSGEESAQFGPLFTWARTAGEAGSRAMSALERYIQQRTRIEARPRSPHPMQSLHRLIAETEKQFATASAAFVSAAVEVPRSPSRASELDARVEEMRKAADLLAALDHMPATLDLLAQFKPKPGGGLERRVALAAQAIVNPTGNDHVRAASVTALHDLHRLGQLAAELSRVDISGVSPTVRRKCAGGRLPALNQKWRDIVTQLASELAAGNELKQADLHRLAQAQVLYDAVRQATVLESALMDGGVLERWVDWRMAPEDLKPLFVPYQEAMSQAFAGYVSDQPEALETWAKLERRYRPVIELMVRAGACRDQCARFPPPGPLNLAASFSTPLEGAPFATERFTALCMNLYRHFATSDRTDAAMGVLNAYLTRVGAE